MANKRDLKKTKDKLSYKIRNIKDDYVGVLKEDMPDEVVQELKDLMSELKAVREELVAKT